MLCTDTDAGYGFVDFDSEQAADLAVKALKSEGRQAQMARVCILCYFVALTCWIEQQEGNGHIN